MEQKKKQTSFRLQAPEVSHDAIDLTAPLENRAGDVTARATESTWYRQQWACNSDQFRIMPSASSQSSMQITAQMENNDLPKNVLSLLEKKVRNLEKRKVRFWLCLGDRTRVDRSVNHAMMIFAVLTGNNSILFAGKARFLQKAGGCWRNVEWRSKGAFIREEFQLNFTCEINGRKTGRTFVQFLQFLLARCAFFQWTKFCNGITWVCLTLATCFDDYWKTGNSEEFM